MREREKEIEGEEREKIGKAGEKERQRMIER